MTHSPAPLNLLRHTTLAITGQLGTGSRVEMQNDLVKLLKQWQGVLIIDELQNTKAVGLQELVWLYEETGHAFGLVIVGTGVLAAAELYPQLASRIMGAVGFEPLYGDALIIAVQHLDQRLAATRVSLLAQHDQTACAGLLRRWVHTVRWLNAFGVTGAATADDLAQVRRKLALLTPTIA